MIGGRWYPCCCTPHGYGSSVIVPPGSSGSDIFGQRGSSGQVACSCCAGGAAPLQVQVEVDGVVANLPGLCDRCDDYNAAYILTWTNDPADAARFCFFPGSVCWWALDFPTTCGRSRAHLAIGCGPTAVEVQFAVMPTLCSGGGQWLRWARVVPLPPSSFDCWFDGLELPPASLGANDCSTLGPARLYAV